ncbi:hypothetical protein [Thermoproteus tenax]|uniref:hypothetical protein n=1 Tax=Thermoproteus tenax TaxID=2271 RepID=UPI00069BCBAC|nr:hypothetical protein [Thermoproteus tenax]
MEKKSQTVKLAALAALAAAVMAVALSAGAFKMTYTHENGVVKTVDPQGSVHTVALNLTEGVKKAEVRLLPNCTLLWIDDSGRVLFRARMIIMRTWLLPNGSIVLPVCGRVITITNYIVMRGGEARRAEFKLLPNGTLLVIDDSGKILFRGRIEREVGAEGAGQAGEKPSPDIIKAPQPISGTPSPGAGDGYGPYTGLVNVEFNVSWSSTGFLCLGYIDWNTTTLTYTCSYGQSASASFPVNPSDYISPVVINPSSYSITYSGTLTLYYQ